MTALPPFHLAFPVADLEQTRSFYVDVLGCSVGRESDRWIDFNFYGHQITAHLRPEETKAVSASEVDGKAVPVRHFGAILDWEIWHELAEQLKAAGIDFVIEPYVRFPGEVGEQATMFFKDPSGNALEFKSFRDMSQVFAH
ncbi:VOC family protein [Fodinicurvata fenggangensis]|uniref:VOC family protein n=1 Tax=Fodinicurvata fenggangensis TaxID=1121830 RepID=UPI00047BC3EB|nr:VOC family protein [Fodinicurvata fenggangensis]